MGYTFADYLLYTQTVLLFFNICILICVDRIPHTMVKHTMDSNIDRFGVTSIVFNMGPWNMQTVLKNFHKFKTRGKCWEAA